MVLISSSTERTYQPKFSLSGPINPVRKQKTSSSAYGSGKNETKELPGVLIINKNDEVYGATYEVVNILKDALSKLESSETFGNIDNKDEIEDTSNNEKDNNSSKDDISTDNKKGNTLKTGEVVGIGAVIMLILSASIAGIVMYKKKEIE